VKKTPYLTVTQLAEKAGVSNNNIRQLLTSGSIQGLKLGPKMWIIPMEEVDRYLDRREGRQRASFPRKRHT